MVQAGEGGTLGEFGGDERAASLGECCLSAESGLQYQGQ
jgi:hypothetical protein